MDHELALALAGLCRGREGDFLAEVNAVTAPVGLALTGAELAELRAARGEALHSTGRLEWGEGILGALIRAFYTSPYLDRENYAGTLEVLQESFYALKNEAGTAADDGELLAWMRRYFDGVCHGDADALAGTGFGELYRAARRDFVPEGGEEEFYGRE